MQVKNAERLWWLEVRRQTGWLALMIMTRNACSNNLRFCGEGMPEDAKVKSELPSCECGRDVR